MTDADDSTDETAELVIREAVADDAAAIARVYVATWRDTYAGILPDAYLAKLNVQSLTRSWRNTLAQREHVLVATVGDDVIGFASGGPEPHRDPFFRSEIDTLYVHPDAQRQGVGGQLLLEMLRLLEARAPVIVWVLEDNVGAREFYEAYGGVPVRERRETVGGEPLGQIAYAFFDVG